MAELPFFYWPPLDMPPLPPGWRWDSGYAVFMGLAAKQVMEAYSAHSGRRSLAYYQLSALGEYIPTMPGYVYNFHFARALVGCQREQKAKRKNVEVELPPKVQVALNRLGATNNLLERMTAHLERTLEGSPLIAAALEAGIDVRLSALWLCDSFEAALQLENIFHRQHNDMALCPLCVHQRDLAALPRRAEELARQMACLAVAG